MIVVSAGLNTALVGAYVSEKTGCELRPDMFQALALINDDGDFCGGVTISEYRGYDCQISCAVETSVVWRDSVIRGVFDYVFNQLRCVRCTCMTKKNNKRTRDFLERLGFLLEGRIRRGFDGTADALVYGLLASECRYLSQETDGIPAHEEAGDSVPYTPKALKEFW
jgi:hypothetical protein